MKKLLSATVASLFALPQIAAAEEVMVKYRGWVDLAPFECEDITRSSFIETVCYDTDNEYLLIEMNGTYYHYCEVDPSTVHDFLSAKSMGKFYNAYIKSRGGDGPFDCRSHTVPEY